VRLLLESGADAGAKDGTDATALDMVLERGCSGSATPRLPPTPVCREVEALLRTAAARAR
jgi:hypothetical protein